MNVVLWVVQAILAAFFLAVRTGKLIQPKEKLRERMAWVEDVPQPAIRLIAIAELLGAVGLILPMLITSLPNILTPLAGAGLGVTMFGAAALHARRKEGSMIAGNAALLVVAALVAIGRFAVQPAALS